ncbi:hypothetical protein ABPG72_018556 [Tetrahymena utriculariae]
MESFDEMESFDDMECFQLCFDEQIIEEENENKFAISLSQNKGAFSKQLDRESQYQYFTNNSSCYKNTINQIKSVLQYSNFYLSFRKEYSQFEDIYYGYREQKDVEYIFKIKYQVAINDPNPLPWQDLQKEIQVINKMNQFDCDIIAITKSICVLAYKKQDYFIIQSEYNFYKDYLRDSSQNSQKYDNANRITVNQIKPKRVQTSKCNQKNTQGSKKIIFDHFINVLNKDYADYIQQGIIQNKDLDCKTIYQAERTEKYIEDIKKFKEKENFIKQISLIRDKNLDFCDELINEIEKIVDESMIQKEIEKRINIFQLHKKFYEKLIDFDSNQYFSTIYVKQIKEISNLFPFDSNKDLDTFLEFILHYKSVYLSLLNKINSEQSKEEVVNCMEIIANCYHNIGDKNKALEFLQESLKLKREIFLGNHPQIALSLYNIALCYSNQSKFYLSLDYQKQCLSIRREIYGDNHYQVSKCIFNIGICYMNLCKYQVALKYLFRSFFIRKSFFKYNHYSITLSLDKISLIFEKTNKFRKSLNFLFQSLQKKIQIYQPNELEIAKSLCNIGICYYHLGDNKIALEYFQDSLNLKKVFLKIEYSFLYLIFYIGICHFEQDNIQMALKYFLEVDEKNTRLKLNDNLLLAPSLFYIGNCYQILQNNKLALKFYLKYLKVNFKSKNLLKYLELSLQTQKQFLVENNLSIAETLENIGKYYLDIKNKIMSLRYLLESLEMKRQILGFYNQQIVRSLQNIVQYHKQFGNNINANKYLTKISILEQKICWYQKPIKEQSNNWLQNAYDLQKQERNYDDNSQNSNPQNQTASYLQIIEQMNLQNQNRNNEQIFIDNFNKL